MQEEMKNCRKYAPKMIKYRDLADGAARRKYPNDILNPQGVRLFRDNRRRDGREGEHARS